MKITKNQAVKYSRDGLEGQYYQLPDTNKGMTVACAKLTGVHGERTVGEYSRIYYILSGQGEFTINDRKIDCASGDVVTIPPHATYDFRPTSEIMELLLIMDLLDLSKLPK